MILSLRRIWWSGTILAKHPGFPYLWQTQNQKSFLTISLLNQSKVGKALQMKLYFWALGLCNGGVGLLGKCFILTAAAACTGLPLLHSSYLQTSL